MHRTRTWNMDQPVLRGRNRVLPIEGGDGSTLSLDFTAMSSLDSRFTFTRASTATYINSSGLVTTMAAASTNDPTKARFDYDPTTLAPRGLLIEGSATNLLYWSESFDTSGAAANWNWSALNVTRGTVSTSDPTGATSTVVKIQETTGNGIHAPLIVPPASISSTYTTSVFAKAVDRTYVQLFENGGSGANTMVNLSNGAVVSESTAGITTVTAIGTTGWYRIAMRLTTGGAQTSVNIQYRLSTNGSTTSYTGTTGNGIYIWGAQLETGSGASSYVASSASQGQRAADVCTLSGTNFSSWFNSTEGTFLATGERAITSNFGRLLSANANNTTSAFDLGASTTGRWLITNTTSQADITAGTVTANTAFKVAGAFASNDAQMAFNGTLGTADTSVSLPTVSQLDIGADRTAVYLNGRIRIIKFWPTRLPNATLQSLTA